jgi:hypothetical protein
MRRLAGPAFAVALLALSGRAGTLDLPLPGPAPRAAGGPVAGIGAPRDEGCIRCHEEITAEWRGSLHHRAWQNAYFARAYALEPLPFCRKCHATTVDPSSEPSPEAREMGIGCTTCHVVPAGIVGARSARASAGGHEVIGDARLATAAACGGCHDFAFPGPPGFAAGPMQDTLGEHQRSAHAGTTCQGCHMPLMPSRAGGAHRGHAFKVQGDRAMMGRAVKVEGAELVASEVRLTVAPGAIGHAFPTGDLYRQAEVRVTPIDHAGHAVAEAATVVFGRTFGPARVGRDTLVQVQKTDTRLTAPRRLSLPVPAATRRARWQVVWQRVPPWLAPRLGMKASEHETVVAEGVVTR